MKRFLWRSVVLAWVISVLGSCGPDPQTRAGCDAVCNRYRTCFNDDYDVPACIANCEDDADREPAFVDEVAACHSCIEGRSCVGTTFACATECLGIVP